MESKEFNIVLLYYMVKLLNFLQAYVDALLSLLLGFTTLSGWKCNEEKSDIDYHSSAQVVNFWLCGNTFAALKQGRHFFFTTHSEYTSPDIILQNDNIIIMGMDNAYVWFAIIPEHVL